MQAILLMFTSIKHPTGKDLQRETTQMAFPIGLSGQVSRMERKLLCSTWIFPLCVSWTHQIWTKTGRSIATSDNLVHALIINFQFSLPLIVSNLYSDKTDIHSYNSVFCH